MRHFILFLIVTAASAADVSVAVPDTLPAAAQAAVDRYTADVAKIREDADKAVAKKSAELAKVLIKAQDEVTKKGDLQGALAVKAKIAGLPVAPGMDVLGNKKPEPEKLPTGSEKIRVAAITAVRFGTTGANVDVKSTFISNVCSQSREIKLTAQLFGVDPAPNQAKTVTVEYLTAPDTKKIKTFIENETIIPTDIFAPR